MASKFFQSFRKNLQPVVVKKRDFNLDEVDGTFFNAKNTDYGFIENPCAVSYDPILNLIAIISKEGKMQIFGKPGFLISAYIKTNSQPLQIYFVPGSFKILLLTVTDDIHVLVINQNESPAIIRQEHLCPEISMDILRVSNDLNSTNYTVGNLTAMSLSSDGCMAYLGNERTTITILKIDQIKESLRITPGDVFDANFFKSRMTDQRSSKYSDSINGAVVTLLERPGHNGQILIGLSTGLCLIMDYKKKSLVALLPWNYHLESAAWCGGSGYPSKPGQTSATPSRELGDRLICSFSNGSMSVWPLAKIAGDDNTAMFIDEFVPIVSMEQAPLMPYGPFPCEEITKILWLPSSKGGITALIGGMPSSTYKDKHTISLLRGSTIDNATKNNIMEVHRRANDDFTDSNHNQMSAMIKSMPPVQVFDPDAPEHVCFELTSKLIDACPIGPVHGPIEGLLLLCEAEMLLIDLESDNWPLFKLPYLNCLQTSPITSTYLAHEVNSDFLNHLKIHAKHWDERRNWSKRDWPLQGGEYFFNGQFQNEQINNMSKTQDLLFTGHQSGQVNIWQIGPNGCLNHMLCLNTSKYFEDDINYLNIHNDSGDEDTPWPPFRKVGLYDPFFDDDRLGIKQISLVHNTLLVGTVAGVVTSWSFSTETLPVGSFNTYKITIQRNNSNFNWNGPKPLKIKEPDSLDDEGDNELIKTPELDLNAIIQISPPGCIVSLVGSPIILSDNTEVGTLIGVGTVHGYSLIFNRTDIPRSFSADNSANIILKVSTLPHNNEAMKEASHGLSWASRRSRYLKQSLRDSFRRLKRNKTNSQNAQNLVMKNQATNDTLPSQQVPLISQSRVGIRRTVTSNATIRSNTGTAINPNEILDAAQIKAAGLNPEKLIVSHSLGPEREITDRPAETASNAIVKAIIFSKIILRKSPKPFDSSEYPAMLYGSYKNYFPLCSFFVGTAAGVIRSFQLFGSIENNNYRIIAEPYKDIVLYHRAPVISLSVLGYGTIPLNDSGITTGIYPLHPSGFLIGPIKSNEGTKITLRSTGYLCVMSEEQVRLYLLPSFSSKYKNKLTAREGFRIRIGSIIKSPILKPNISLPNPYHLTVINYGGNAVFMEMNNLRDEDALALVDENNNFAMASLVFGQPSTFSNVRISDSVGAISKVISEGSHNGIYLTGPGQIVHFNFCPISIKTEASNYRVTCRLSIPTRKCEIDPNLAYKLLLQESEDFSPMNFDKKSVVMLTARTRNN